MFSHCEVDLSELRDTRFSFPCCGCSPLYEVGDEDSEAVFLFSLSVGALLFIRAMLLAPEANFVLLFRGCSPCYEDGVVALEANSVFPFLWVLSLV